MEQHISSPTHLSVFTSLSPSLGMYYWKQYSIQIPPRIIVLQNVLLKSRQVNVKKKIRQLKSRIKTDCGGGDEVKTRHSSITVSPLVPVPQEQFFKWLFHKSRVASEMQLVSFLTILICHGPGSNPRSQIPWSGHCQLSYRGVYNNQI